MTVLITDLDNTLYNLIDFFGPSFRAMVHALSKTFNIIEEDLIYDFKTVFVKRESLEYSFSVQELELVENLPYEEVFNMIRVAKGAFKRSRDKYLFPYPTVKETLEWLRNEGILIIGCSNAPSYHAEIRLKQLHLDRFFYGLAARKELEVPTNRYTEAIHNNILQGKYKSAHIKKRWSFEQTQMKPNNYAYLTILNDLGVKPCNAYIIGDSIVKDIEPAIRIGAIGIWAKYGGIFKQKNIDTVLKMTNWSEADKKKVFLEKHNEPEIVVNSFSQLRNIIPPMQTSLFD